MGPGVLLRYTHEQLNSLFRLSDLAGTEGLPLLTSEDYVDLISLMLDFPGSYRRAVDSEQRRLFTDRSRTVEQLQQVRSDLEVLASRYLELVRTLKADPVLCALVGQESSLQTGVAKLDAAVRLLEAQKTRLADEWPVCDPEEVSRALDEKGATFLPVDQAFAGMKGIPVEELHRRLEEHKTRRKDYGWE